MAITTGSKKMISPEERKRIIAEMREYHMPYLSQLDEGTWRFIAKMKYGFPPDRSKFFENEIDGSKELYVEWVSRFYQPEDSRRLYRYKFNPDYLSEYPKETTPEGYEWFVVPAERFELVKEGIEEQDEPVVAHTKESVQETLDLDFDIINPDEDCPMDNITLRDWAAILLKAPVSRKEWLNKIIKDSCQK